MRTLPIVFPALLLLGCKPQFTELGEACHEKVPGAARIEAQEAVGLIERANCYRRLAGLYRGPLDRTVQEAVENHLAYVVEHRPWETGTSFFQEEPGRIGYTGVDIFQRMDSLGFEFGDITGWGVWEFAWLDVDLPPDDVVDYYMPDPFWRQVFLQPDWHDSGYAEAVDEETGTLISYGTLFYRFPTSERENSPIVYPRDGQVDVPFSYRSIDPFDSLYEMGEVGFPITVTFSDSTVTRFDPMAENPYDIQVKTASLRGPDGELDMRVVMPPGDSAGDLLRYSLVAVPLAPLAPDARYVFEAEVSWGMERRKTVRSEFRTARTPDFRTTYLDGLEAGARVPQGHLRRLTPGFRR